MEEDVGSPLQHTAMTYTRKTGVALDTSLYLIKIHLCCEKDVFSKSEYFCIARDYVLLCINIPALNYSVIFENCENTHARNYQHGMLFLL